MKKISSIIGKIKLKSPELIIKKEFQKIIKNKFDFEIEIKDISIKFNKIYFNAPAVLKKEFQFEKKQIIKKINSKINEERIVDII